MFYVVTFLSFHFQKVQSLSRSYLANFHFLLYFARYIFARFQFKHSLLTPQLFCADETKISKLILPIFQLMKSVIQVYHFPIIRE